MKILKSILLLSFLLLPTLALAAELSGIAVILKTAGSVQHKANKTEVWAAAQQGQVLSSGDALRTLTGGEVAILFVDDKSLLKLAEETEITIQASAEGRTVSKRIWMGAGDLWAKVTKQDNPHFQVETPTSVASVKGSVFYSQERPGTGNRLFAISGRYAYGNEFGQIELSGGSTGLSDGLKMPVSRSTRDDELPAFGGVNGYGQLDEDGERVIRIGFQNEDDETRTLVIPLEQPE
ncbi:FecR domain-containing protein [bacterium]|nr:FecR domain-containing protein [bacterium]